MTFAPSATLAEPFMLPNGSFLANRIAEQITSQYWTEARTRCCAGLLITETIIVDRTGDGVSRNDGDDRHNIDILTELASAARSHGAQVWVPLALARNRDQVSAQPAEDLVGRFARTATALIEAGFQGIEIVATDSGLLSPSGRLLGQVVRGVRAGVGTDVTLAVRLSSARFPRRDDRLGDLVRSLVDDGVDLLEMDDDADHSSGPQASAARTPVSLDSTDRIRSQTHMAVLLTRQFRTSTEPMRAIDSGAVDLVSLRRPRTSSPCSTPARAEMRVARSSTRPEGHCRDLPDSPMHGGQY